MYYVAFVECCWQGTGKILGEDPVLVFISQRTQCASVDILVNAVQGKLLFVVRIIRTT